MSEPASLSLASSAESETIDGALFSVSGKHCLFVALDASRFWIFSQQEAPDESGIYRLTQGTTPRFEELNDNRPVLAPCAESFLTLPDAYKQVEPGLYSVVGLPGYGKSFLLNWFRDYERVKLITCFESPEPDREVSTMAITERQFFHHLGDAMVTSKRIAVDSIQRFVFATGGGAAMAGGVSPKVWTILSAWAALFRALDRIVFVTMNPLADDPERLAPFKIAAQGATTGVIVIDRPRVYKISCRYPKSAMRSYHEFTLNSAQEIAAESEDAAGDDEVVTILANDDIALSRLGISRSRDELNAMEQTRINEPLNEL